MYLYYIIIFILCYTVDLKNTSSFYNTFVLYYMDSLGDNLLILCLAFKILLVECMT